MKTIVRLGILLTVVCNFAVAQDDPGFYIGSKAGYFSISADDADDTSSFDADDTTGLGLVFGYNFGYGISVEFEYNKSNDVDLNASLNGFTVTSSEADLEWTALYFAYRTGGDLYGKVRTGYLREKVDVELKATEIACFFDCEREASTSGSDSFFSLGLGVGGAIIEALNWEAEYTLALVDTDVNYFSAGLTYSF